MVLLSWNVNGIRSALRKGFLDYLARERPQAICLQEVRAKQAQVPLDLEGYTQHWNSAQRPGYAGTAVFTRMPPLGVLNELDAPALAGEGRVQTLEFATHFLVNVYTPNVGRELGRLAYRAKEWDPAFRSHVQCLAKRKPVIFCGDLNVAHEEIDLARPKANHGNAGFTPEERTGFGRLLQAGFVDSFRVFHGEGGHYSWWSARMNARARNIGWRIDYFCVSEDLRSRLRRAWIQPEVHGSDHCPVALELDL